MMDIRKTALTLATGAMLCAPVAGANAASFAGPTSAHEGTAILKSGSEADYRRRYRHYRHRHHDHIDGGDILAGIGILAGIAIIAGAASEGRKDRSRREPPPPPPEPDYPDYSGPDYRGNDGYADDIGGAINACSNAASEGAGSPVGEIESVSRDGAGWRVEGVLGGRDSRAFSCGVTGGQVDFIQFGGRAI